MANEYKLVIQLDETSISRTQQADPKPDGKTKDQKMTDGEKTSTFLDKVKNSTAGKVGASIGGSALLVGKEIYDYKLVTAKTLGYDNQSLRMREGMSLVTRGSSIIGGAIVTGNPVGAVAVIAYQALDLAKENRQRTLELQLDAIVSEKQSQRLIYNTSGRSRG